MTAADAPARLPAEDGTDLTDLTAMTLAEARDGLRARRFTARELTASASAARSSAPRRSTPLSRRRRSARSRWRGASDARLAAGTAGPLEGLPIGIKDLYATEGVHTQACSHILDGFKPTYESTVTANLWRDGAVMLGKLNMDEFAMGSSNETSYYGPSPRHGCRRTGARRRRARR